MIAVCESYARIQSNRIAGETDLAVDFVNHFLEG